jgi:hypothetical protein
MTRRLLTYGAFAAAVVVVEIVAIAAFQSLQTTYQNPTPVNATPSTSCSPAPCANLQDYYLWVSNLNVGSDLVTMQIVFRNSSGSTHAAPEDLKLIDAARHASAVVFDAPGCTSWSRHTFDSGATYGPITVCFRLTNASTPLVLRWSPDFGLLCCQTDIKLD